MWNTNNLHNKKEEQYTKFADGNVENLVLKMRRNTATMAVIAIVISFVMMLTGNLKTGVVCLLLSLMYWYLNDTSVMSDAQKGKYDFVYAVCIGIEETPMDVLNVANEPLRMITRIKKSFNYMFIAAAEDGDEVGAEITIRSGHAKTEAFAKTGMYLICFRATEDGIYDESTYIDAIKVQTKAEKASYEKIDAGENVGKRAMRKINVADLDEETQKAFAEMKSISLQKHDAIEFPREKI